MRGIIGYIFFFTVGLISAGAYFYQLHPEHSIDGDVPRLRKDVDDALDRGRRLREAWNACGASDEASTQSTVRRGDKQD